jgi:hypothetical protein
MFMTYEATRAMQRDRQQRYEGQAAARRLRNPTPFSSASVAESATVTLEFGHSKSIAENARSFWRRCRALTVRTVPDLDRMTRDCVVAPRES